MEGLNSATFQVFWTGAEKQFKISNVPSCFEFFFFANEPNDGFSAWTNWDWLQVAGDAQYMVRCWLSRIWRWLQQGMLRFWKNACGMNTFNSETSTARQGAVRVLQQGENGTHRQSVISEQKKHGYSGTVPTLTLSACIFYSCSVDLLCKETRGMKILKNACAMSTFNSVLSSAHSDKIAGPTLFHIYHGANCRATVRRGWKVTDRLWFLARETAVYWTTFECLFAPRKNFPSPAPYLVVLHVFFTLLQASICMPVQEKPGDKVPWMLFHDMLLQAGNACGMRALNSDKA
jgi:hypothetical protein